MSFMSNSKNGKSRPNGNLIESLYDKSNIFSKYALSHMIPLFRISFKRQLTIEDLGPPPRIDYSRTLGLQLRQIYNQEILTRKRPSFTRSLVKLFGLQMVLLSLTDFASKCIAFPMQTIALGWLIRDAGIYLNFDQALAAATTVVNATATVPPLATGPAVEAIAQGLTSDQAYWAIIYDSIYLILFTAIAIVLAHPFFFQTYHMGMRCRIAACYMIYRKSLSLSQSAMSETTVGQMVNLLSNDVNRFDQVCQMLPYLVVAPLQAITVVTLLSVFYLGFYPTLASLAAILTYVIIQTSMGSCFSRLRSKTAKRTDERVRLMNEIILAMKIIKMYAWERPFKTLVYSARRREMVTIGCSSILKVINQTLFFISSKVIVFVALITYVLLGNSFNPEIVFVSIGLANLVRISLTLFFPMAIAYVAETHISCKRINNFLQLPEIEQVPLGYKYSPDVIGCKYVVTMHQVEATWLAHKRPAGAADASKDTQEPAGRPIIRNLSLSVRPRELVLVVGRVGAGKSSVLMSILGELPLTAGRLEVNGRISYASQEAWIFSGTVRDNILFGKEHQLERYNQVIRVCSLERDLEILLNGDQTIVGERGVSLSGGQKARVNLARALYQEADLYLLDDPLSAVDAPVAKHIFNESLRTFLRKKTVILATHQLQFLRHATRVLVLDRDSPAAFGSLEEVMQSEAFSVVNYSKEAFEDATTAAETTDVEQRDSRAASKRRSEQSSRSSAATSRSSAASGSPPCDANNAEARLIRASSQASSNLNESVKVLSPLALVDGTEQEAKKLLSEAADDAPAEQKALKRRLAKESQDQNNGSARRQGTEILSAVSTNCSTYMYYLRNASGVIMFTWFILTNILAQGFYQYCDYFLSFWTDSVQRKEYQGANFTAQTFVDNLTIGQMSGIYGLLIGIIFVATFLRSATFFVGTLRASINIHNKLFKSVIHAPMTFFDFSPIGILLNRLTRDIGFVDETLPQTAVDIVIIFVNLGGTLVLAIFLDLNNLYASIVLFVLAFLLRSLCARTVTRLKQIEGVTRSPIFSHLSTTLSGLPTIRAFRVQDEFVRIFDSYQDTHTSAWFNYISSGRWLAVYMDWLCLMFIVLVIALLLAFSLNATNASLIGLLISQVIILPGPFQWGMRQLIELESQMTSVQRIKEFSELKSERQLMSARRDSDNNLDETSSLSVSSSDEISKQKSERRASEKLLASYQSGKLSTPVDTPNSEGEIKFVNLSLSYFADEPPVLRNLNLVIRPREKVGIVGRTGAGKSSIVSVLFRLYDFEGRIEIDGVDTKQMALGELRRSMSIIPQDPVLFGGTLRKNLDPFNEHTDSELWLALEAVQLRPLFARHPKGLESRIQEGGSNFSVGQRQLVCLARAIVRRNKLLVLDEATANVDPETDSFIQRTIAHQFAHCTVLTIAHRLITIVDSDRVLVLDRGEVREFGEPYELYVHSLEGAFARLVDGHESEARAELLLRLEQAHERRHPAGSREARPQWPTRKNSTKSIGTP